MLKKISPILFFSCLNIEAANQGGSQYLEKIQSFFPEIRANIAQLPGTPAKASFFQNAHRFQAALKIALEKGGVNLEALYALSSSGDKNWVEAKKLILSKLRQENETQLLSNDALNDALFRAILDDSEEAEKFIKGQNSINRALDKFIGAHYDLVGAVLFALTMPEDDAAAKKLFLHFHDQITLNGRILNEAEQCIEKLIKESQEAFDEKNDFYILDSKYDELQVLENDALETEEGAQNFLKECKNLLFQRDEYAESNAKFKEELCKRIETIQKEAETAVKENIMKIKDLFEQYIDHGLMVRAEKTEE